MASRGCEPPAKAGSAILEVFSAILRGRSRRIRWALGYRRSLHPIQTLKDLQYVETLKIGGHPSPFASKKTSYIYYTPA